MAKIGVSSSLGQVGVTYSIPTKYKPAYKIEIGQWWVYRDSKGYDWAELPDWVDNLEDGLDNLPENICAVVVVDKTTTSFGMEEVKVEFMVADDRWSPWGVGDAGWFIDQNFSLEDQYFKVFWDPWNGLIYENPDKANVAGLSSSAAVIEYGINCGGCKNYFPHAEKVDGFKCWACRNGF